MWMYRIYTIKSLNDIWMVCKLRVGTLLDKLFYLHARNPSQAFLIVEKKTPGYSSRNQGASL